jgi:hypothetical protein
VPAMTHHTAPCCKHVAPRFDPPRQLQAAGSKPGPPGGVKRRVAAALKAVARREGGRPEACAGTCWRTLSMRLYMEPREAPLLLLLLVPGDDGWDEKRLLDAPPL